MAKLKKMITEEQWKKLEPLLPVHTQSSKGGHKPRSNREVFESIIWVLRNSARWNDLPNRYPSASTCWRRLQQLKEQGIRLQIWRKFLSELDEQSQIDWE